MLQGIDGKLQPVMIGRGEVTDEFATLYLLVISAEKSL
jgi:hypothetical protein